MSTSYLAGRSILIVEDEVLIALDIGQAFESVGANVKLTGSVELARVLLKNEEFSAAVIDQALPDGDSEDLCRDLGKNNVPFVIYSGFNSKVLLAGFQAVYIAKPNTPELVVAAVERLLESGSHFLASHAPRNEKSWSDFITDRLAPSGDKSTSA